MAGRAGASAGPRALAGGPGRGGASLTVGSGGPGGRTRVLYVINDLARAGAETQLVTLALAMPTEKYEVKIALLKRRNDFGAVLAAGGIPVVALDRRGPADAAVVLRLAREVLRFRPQVLHSFLFPANLLAALVGRLAGVPRVVVSQRSSYEATLARPWRGLARLGHRLAHRVIVNSRAALEEEIAAGCPPHRIVHVPNAVPRPGPEGPSDDVPAAGFVLSLGQLDARKGHAGMIAAWPAVVRVHPAARLVLVGDGPCRGDLEAQARALGVLTSVTFAGFRAPARPFVSASRLLVQPSLTEGMPNAVLEAMAAGRPVVASRTGGIPELVVHEETGLLVAPGDHDALAAAIVRMLSDPAAAEGMGAAGAARAQRLFSIESTRRAIETIYGTNPS